ncbi:leucine-rich repeat-containing protein 15-like [Lepisosteus oculatus]|uniref:leucine-rich repeat-containing protein 15-like n=1 Tax=Lepisosteus oculatus TaxID=7918 RepID=UPI0037227C09
MATLILLLISLWMGVAAEGCPAGCVCSPAVTDCSRAGLRNLPWDIAPQTETLFLSDNQLTSILKGAFRNLTALTFLGLSRNKICPENDTLESLINLLSLDVSENDLQSIPIGFLQAPFKMVWINLAKNQLKTLPDGTFAKLQSLTYLDLSDNSMLLHNNIFEGLARLNTLILSGNRLTTIPSQLFDPTPKLQILDLSNNALTHLPTRLLYHQHNLSDLILNNNRFTQSVLPALRGLRNLRFLYLSGNSISSLPPFPFINLSHLTKLTLSNNSLSKLPDGFLTGLYQLTVLDLSGNSIFWLPRDVFQNNTALEYLYLDRNDFSKMPMLLGLQNVQELKICCCKIHLWPAEVFISHMEDLELLDLSSNFIAEMDFDLLKSNLNLKKVLMTNNPVCSTVSSKLSIVPPVTCI